MKLFFRVFVISAIMAFIGVNAKVSAQDLYVPMKWCLVEGSLLHQTTGGNRAAIRAALWARHERPSDRIYIPQAGITLRSAAIASIPDFPVIPDPFPPGSFIAALGIFAPGAEGDLISPALTSYEVNVVRNSCARAWSRVPHVGGVGLYAINLNQFVDINPTRVSPVKGYCGFGVRNDSCLVIDYERMVPGSPHFGGVAGEDGQLLAHEVGHAFQLRHHDNSGTNNLMHSGIPSGRISKKLLPWQVAIARNEIISNIGAFRTSVAGSGLLPPTRRALFVDDVADPARYGDVPAQSLDKTIAIDIDSLRVSEINFGSTMELDIEMISWSDPANWDKSLVYYIAFDLDNDPTTGGQPDSYFGPTTNREGIELVLAINLEIKQGGKHVAAIGRQFIDGKFEIVSGINFNPTVLQPIVEVEKGKHVVTKDVVSVSFPKTLIAKHLTYPYQVEAGVYDQDIKFVDRINAAVIYDDISYATCETDKTDVINGDKVLVTADDLANNQMAKFFLGTEMLPIHTNTDQQGKVKGNFEVRTERNGKRLITVGTEGAAITAVCSINVLD